MIHLQIDESLQAAGVSAAWEGDLLEKAARQTLEQASGVPDDDLTIVLTGDEQVQQLNQQYLGVDAPTDVLSFPAGDPDPDSEHLYLGDVIISYPRAQAQAEVGGHPVESELQLLVVHGVLHLLGFDHAEEEEKAVMWGKQGEVLNSLGLGGIRLPE
jgi:probable rRNA maturation factor